MALGGGTFQTQNKVLPGSYINFITRSKANQGLSDRGIATMPLDLDWGMEGEVFTVTSEDFQKKTLPLFGYEYTHEKLKGLRDLFRNIKTLYAYRLASDGVKASNAFATAKYSGIRGNDLSVVIEEKTVGEFEVKTILQGSVVDTQIVKKWGDLVGNDFVNFIAESTLEATAGTPMVGGTNGTVTAQNHQKYMDKIESYGFHAMGVDTADAPTQLLYSSFVKRMREEVGAKFQVVLFNSASDYEGVISVKNKIMDTGWTQSALVYWVTGISAGCLVNRSNLNAKYNGEFTVDVDYTQAALSAAIVEGYFTLHKVGSDVRVLADITSLVSITETKGELFKENQTMRVVDQIANDIGTLFNTKYLGIIPNDASGRVSLWADIVKHHFELQTMRAIENFSDKDITVEQGSTKKSVVVSDTITIVGAMGQLYMTVEVA